MAYHAIQLRIVDQSELESYLLGKLNSTTIERGVVIPSLENSSKAVSARAVYICRSYLIRQLLFLSVVDMATPHNAARVNGEKNWILMMALFQRNTLVLQSDEIRAHFFWQAS